MRMVRCDRRIVSSSATIQNAENIGLEPVWPYDLIGDTSPLFALAKRTYEHRLFLGVADWSFDPVQAARLGLGDEVKSMLVRVTERSQHSINGLLTGTSSMASSTLSRSVSSRMHCRRRSYRTTTD